MSQSEKEGEVGDEGKKKKEEHISQEDKNNSLNSQSKETAGESSITGKEDSKNTEETLLIEPGKEGSGEVGKTDRENEKANKISKEKGGDENHLKAGEEQRKGASSPSPSVGKSTSTRDESCALKEELCQVCLSSKSSLVEFLFLVLSRKVLMLGHSPLSSMKNNWNVSHWADFGAVMSFMVKNK